MSETGLRAAQPADLPLILAMLHELGRSEGVSQVATTLDHLQRALFGGQPAAYCQLIVHGQAVAGFLIYSWKWATFTGRAEMYMQALYVDAAFRRRGVARAAMAGLAGIALAEDCSRIEWLVVRDNAMSNGFYDACGAIRVDHMAVRRLLLPAMQALSAEAGQTY